MRGALKNRIDFIDTTKFSQLLRIAAG